MQQNRTEHEHNTNTTSYKPEQRIRCGRRIGHIETWDLGGPCHQHRDEINTQGQRSSPSHLLFTLLQLPLILDRCVHLTRELSMNLPQLCLKQARSEELVVSDQPQTQILKGNNGTRTNTPLKNSYRGIFAYDPASGTPHSTAFTTKTDSVHPHPYVSFIISVLHGWQDTTADGAG